jgi:predicted nucleic acid-binding Zn ribbon protein
MKCECGNQMIMINEELWQCEKCGQTASVRRGMLSKKINHEYTGDVVCPWCGDIKDNSHEMFDNFEEDCDNCGKKFRGHRETIVEYCTEKNIGG